MGARRKFYVVWAGETPGIFDSWEECRQSVERFPGARYKSYNSQEEAVAAYRGTPESELGVIRAIAARKPEAVNYEAFPEIEHNAIAVDAGCSRNPGPVEYQGVDLRTGRKVFHVGPIPNGTNNIGEFLAIVHALAQLTKEGRGDVAVYSDSRTAISWIRNRKARTAIVPTEGNAKIRELLARAETWIQTHNPPNRLLKWDTEAWGEIPADFGRK